MLDMLLAAVEGRTLEPCPAGVLARELIATVLRFQFERCNFKGSSRRVVTACLAFCSPDPWTMILYAQITGTDPRAVHRPLVIPTTCSVQVM